MAPPLARTNAEAHLFMDLRPCVCGETAFDRRSAVLQGPDGLLSRYTGTCPRCGRERTFEFTLPATIDLPRGEVVFGGDEPSVLLDAGEWLLVADAYARRGPADVSGLDEAARRRARHDLATAAAAMDEVLKFAAPGAEHVDGAAFSSPRGRAVRAAEPGRFRVVRLEAVRDTYRDLLADTDASSR